MPESGAARPHIGRKDAFRMTGAEEEQELVSAGQNDERVATRNALIPINA